MQAIENLVAGTFVPEQINDEPALPLFAPETLAFIEAVSGSLMRSSEARGFPELVALAFWLRKSNLERLHAGLKQRQGSALLTPRGTVLHIAPSNVDTIFVYSWFVSLLTGNRNIVRVSSRTSAQSDLLIDTIGKLLAQAEHGAIARRNLLLSYTADDLVTARLSALCDVRVIWGGDATVEQIRRIALPPTAIDVAFPNKYSLAVLHAGRWLETDAAQRQALAHAFYNDAYWFDQMACSSPRLVLWVGSEEVARAAAADFWPQVAAIVAQRRVRFADADYFNKLVAQDSLAIETELSVQASPDNDLVRLWLAHPALHVQHHCGAGMFLESALPELAALRPLLRRTVQTVSYTGITREEWSDFIKAEPLAGIDRIVPFGRALDFGHVWDGIDLFRTFMREISLD